jgi:hypothetical protein
VRNAKIPPHHLFADDQVITAQDKDDAEYTTKN